MPKGTETRARGRFYVLDGVDGCGKSTQAARLVARLAAEGGRPLHLREPGSTRLGEALRELLLKGPEDLSPGVEALLVTAARRHMLELVVEPALRDGRDVVCERFHPSTYAYQGVAGGLGGAAVEGLLTGWAGAPAPDLVVLLDLDPELALARRGPASDRIEARGLAYQRRVAEGYRAWGRDRAGVARVDAACDEDAVERAVWEEVARGRG